MAEEFEFFSPDPEEGGISKEERESRQKARESEMVLQAQLGQLRRDFPERLEESEAARARDRAIGEARAAEQLSAGTLGRVDQDPSARIEGLIAGREADVADLLGDRPEQALQRRRDELDRVQKEFAELRKQVADPDSPGARARRERIELEVDRQLRNNLGAISGLSNVRGIGQQRALISDALQGAQQQRANLTRDMVIANQEAQERIATLGAGAREAALGGLERLSASQRGELSAARRAQEEVAGAARQDLLSRQQFNLQQSASELFGRLGIVDATVQQGIAERAGIRTQQISEIQSAEQSRHLRESERIQEIEAKKPPPSGGGKSVMCVMYWMTGDISDEILYADFRHTIDSPDIDEDVRLCYYAYSQYLGRHITTKGLMYHLFRPMVVSWAYEMAHRQGVESATSNWIGRTMRGLGVPLHKAGGWIMRKVFGCNIKDYDNSPGIEEIFGHARHIWDAAHEEVA